MVAKGLHQVQFTKIVNRQLDRRNNRGSLSCWSNSLRAIDQSEIKNIEHSLAHIPSTALGHPPTDRSP